jgi:hypothetical protein
LFKADRQSYTGTVRIEAATAALPRIEAAAAAVTSA